MKSTVGVVATILVVEDNEEVRDVAVEMLEGEGFRVIAADSASSGLEQFNKHPEIDLVFSDVIMPGGVSGVQMSKQILSLKPETLIILVTGYSEKGMALADDTHAMDNVAYVSKPYDVSEIPKLIGSMIESAEAAHK